MHFLFPMMLLGGLGIGVPILIHLFNRFRFKEVAWGAMELLRKAVIVRKRKIRIEDLILLLLRCLAVLLLAIALARPIIAPHGAPWLGRNKSVSVVIALDASFSMAHKPGAKARFERALDRVRDVAKTLKTGNPVTLVLCGDQPRFLMRNEGYVADRFETKLKTLMPLPERFNVDRCLGEIASSKFLDEIKAPIVEFYLISDAQANSWSPLSDRAGEAIKQMAESGRVYFLPVHSENADNTAITRLDLPAGLPRLGDSTVYVEVANLANADSGRAARNIVVKLLVNGTEVYKDVVTVAPGGKKVVPLYARIESAGPNRIAAQLEADELEIDNLRYAVLDVPTKNKVLLVRAPTAGVAAKDDEDFIAKALFPLVSDSFVLDRVTALSDVKQLPGYQLVILANVPDVTGDEVRKLDSYVKDGGGLLIFLGNNVTSTDLLNQRFVVDNVSLLPGKLTSIVRAKDEYKDGFGVKAVAHPLSKLIGRKDFVDNARVFSYVKMELYPGSREVLKTAGDGDPILAENSVGLGKVILFTSAADRNWTNMVGKGNDRAVVPVLIYETLGFVTRHNFSVNVSDDLLVPLPLADKGKKVVFKPLPEGRPTTRDSEVRDGVVFARLPTVDQPGFYEIQPEGSPAPLFAAVNVDTRESNVQVLTADALAKSFADLPIRVLAESDAFETSVHESRVGRELWKYVLVVLLGLLVVEGLFARWITMKKGPAEEAVPS